MEILRDVGTERAVLSGLFQYGRECFHDVDCLVDTKTFTSPSNQVIYACLKKVLQNQESVDIPSVFSAAKDLGLTESIDNKQQLEYITSLERFPVKKSNVQTFAARIRRLQIGRDVQRVANSIHKEMGALTGDESVDSIISMAESPIFELSMSLDQNTENKPVRLGDEVDEFLNHVMENPCEMLGLDTGFPHYNQSIGGGLRRKSLDLVAARPKAGKSMLAMNVALHITGKLDVPVLVIDTEMAKEDQLARTLACLSGVPTNDIRKGKFADNPEHKESVLQVGKALKELPYHYINVSGLTFEESLSVIKRWIAQNVPLDENGVRKDALVIYDYLKLISSKDLNNNIAEFQALGFNITALYNLVVKYDVSCLSFIQMNREGINKEDSSVVSGSDRQGWLCTSLSLLKPKSTMERAEDGPEHGSRKIVPIMSRHGEENLDENYFNYLFEGECARFEEGKTRNEIKQVGFSTNKGLVSDDEDEPAFE